MSHLDAPFAPTGEHGASAPDGQPVPYQHDPSAPVGAPVASRRSGLALAAFVVALVSLLVSVVPVINVVSIVGGLVGVVLAVVALRKLVPGVTGKGLAVAGIVLGALSVVVATCVLVLTAMAVQAIDSGELDAALAEVAAAQDGAVAEEPAPADAPDAADAAPAPAGDPVAADAPAGDPAATGVREDFSAISCEILDEEAVLMSQESAGGEAALIKIRESAVVEDHRTDYTAPTGADESLVLSCRGTAAWSDATESPVLTELTIDADGELFVAYTPE